MYDVIVKNFTFALSSPGEFLSVQLTMWLWYTKILLLCLYSYRQHCEKRNAPVFNLLRGRFWGCSPSGGDMLHRLGWNLARKRGPFASSALCAGGLSCWKVKNLLEIRRVTGENCCNCITLQVMLLNNLDSMIDKCQTGVMSTTCNSPTDAVTDCTLIVCAGVLSRRLSSWLMDMLHTVSHLTSYIYIIYTLYIIFFLLFYFLA